jgi:hypothetical protein
MSNATRPRSLAVRKTRRAVISAGAAALTLPFLRLLEGTARAAVAPKRVIFFATPNGTMINSFWPSDWNNLGEILGPITPLKSKMIVLRGLDPKSSAKKDNAGNLPRNHALSYPDMLTAWQPAVPAAPAYGGPVDVSLDQAIAKSLAGKTKLASLDLGVDTGTSTGFWLLAKGPGQILFPENSSEKAFANVFGDLPTQGQSGSMDAGKLLANRKSMLDFVKADLDRLRCALGVEERPKFDAHLGAVRALEESLTFTVAASGPACSKPTLATTTDYRATGKNHMDIIVRALACDLTRVASLNWGGGADNTVMDWLGLTAGHHDITHRGSAASALTIKIENWYAQQFFYLCDQLNRIQDVDGRTLLDNTAVVWLHEQQDGGSHGMKDMPWVVGGSCGGFFKTGQMLRFPGTAHTRLLITIAQAMGLSLKSFGDPEFNGPLLSEIIA